MYIPRSATVVKGRWQLNGLVTITKANTCSVVNAIPTIGLILSIHKGKIKDRLTQVHWCSLKEMHTLLEVSDATAARFLLTLNVPITWHTSVIVTQQCSVWNVPHIISTVKPMVPSSNWTHTRALSFDCSYNNASQTKQMVLKHRKAS